MYTVDISVNFYRRIFHAAYTTYVYISASLLMNIAKSFQLAYALKDISARLSWCIFQWPYKYWWTIQWVYTNVNVDEAYTAVYFSESG
jgi:hypothetical protein